MDLTDDDLEGLVTWTLIRAAHSAERGLAALFARHNLSAVQFGVLATLATRPGITQAELARAVLVRPQAITGVVSALLERGLIGRTGSTGRGRRNPIELSTAGEALLEQVWPVVMKANSPSSMGITIGDLSTLNRLLHALLPARHDAS